MRDSRTSLVDCIIRQGSIFEQIKAVDQIMLSANNYEAFDSRLDRRLLSPAFVQESRVTGACCHYQIYNTRYLIQTLKCYRDKQPVKHRINLAWLDPKPEVVQHIAWKWVTTAFATVIWATVLFYIAYFTDLQIRYVEPAGILMSTIAVISLCLFFYASENKVVFNSYLSNVPLLVLDNNRPDRASFDAFVHDVRKGIYAGWQNKDIQQMLVGEIRELRRLRDEGVLSQDTYLRARTEILNHREYQIKSVQVEEALDEPDPELTA